MLVTNRVVVTQTNAIGFDLFFSCNQILVTSCSKMSAAHLPPPLTKKKMSVSHTVGHTHFGTTCNQGLITGEKQIKANGIRWPSEGQAPGRLVLGTVLQAASLHNADVQSFTWQLIMNSSNSHR
jgi:hypothetical protein